MNELKKRTWAEINLNNIEHNYRAIRSILPEGTKFLGVVKADAYGHGAYEVSKRLESIGADYLAVACLDEAVELRDKGISLPILILGHTPPEYTGVLIEKSITQAVSCEAKARGYSQAAKECGGTLKVHIKLDTGMSRMGFLDAGELFETGVDNVVRACKMDNLDVEGIFTHFAVSDVPGEENEKYTQMQYKLFCDTYKAVEEKGGFTFHIHHCANSGATLKHPEFAMDMVRPGFMLYGYGDDENKLGLKPCMRFVSTIATIKYQPEGTSVSYGRNYTTDKRTRMAVVCAGYADGLPWAARGKCKFFTAGKKVPECGNICMDMCMIDVSEAPDAVVGGEVELFGENVSVIDMAEQSGTIAYEILCGVTKRVPRIYIG